MKLLNKRISEISKSVLLYSLLIGGVKAERLVSSDRFLIKILDSTVSYQDINYQLRNLKALDCVYDDSLVTQYFEKGFIKELETFMKDFPKESAAVKTYLHSHEDLMKKIRYLFKILRYSADQDWKVTTELTKLIRETTQENKCQTAVLYKDTLKTNFISLLKIELYLRSRYGSQMTSNRRGFDSIRPSLELFMDSLDKQFGHEYYW